jgi:hypothetical protein
MILVRSTGEVGELTREIEDLHYVITAKDRDIL